MGCAIDGECVAHGTECIECIYGPLGIGGKPNPSAGLDCYVASSIERGPIVVSAYANGIDAAGRNDTLGDNPYRQEDPRWAQWVEGWLYGLGDICSSVKRPKKI